ncbi:acid sphingomyelinase-like phosphodiesterase 3b [Grus japonensis]|uniref:Acid sphingomyelinase-like phosphodiesterase 3b n=1 Tax=Grus japonensis TaxID=30415 RepID=A0ABC9WM76_GRUJA
MPDGSKTDLLLAKAEPISDGGSASGVMYLKRGKKTCATATAAREKSEKNNSADTKISAEGGAGGSPGTGAEIPLQRLDKTVVRQAVPLQPMEVNDGADIDAGTGGGPHARAGGGTRRRL